MSEGCKDIPFPPHVYIPGQTPRHPEDWFDQIKDSIPQGLPPAALAQTNAFRAGLLFLDAGYFWECHEVLEAVWMQTPKGSPEREMVQAIIQFANARLKVLMERPRAAVRLCDMVLAHLERVGAHQLILGQSPDQLRQDVAQLRDQISAL